MRQSISWALVVLAFGFVSGSNGQERRPVGERPESSTRTTQPAEPESSGTRGVTAQGNQAAAPRLVKISGVLTDFVRNSVSSSVEMTFAVYKDEVGGEALWTETQSVEVDKEGRYTVLLGATQADGVPVELFSAGEPRWLGAEIRGQAPQSRTLLVSVPYALKALDAEKLSGKSLSDFVLSESLGDQVRRVVEGQTIVANQAASTGTAQPGQTKASTTSTAATTAAGPMFPPSTFSGANATQIVSVQQDGSGNGLYAQTASGNGTGVIGFNNSAANGNGVAGIANASSGSPNGVYGQINASGGAAVNGQSFGTSGYANGVFGASSSPNGVGVSGVNNSATDGIAVSGVANATSGGSIGVYGQISAPNGAGVIAMSTAPSGFGFGVYAVTASNESTAVSGTATSTSGGTNGVAGISVGTNGGIGTFGVSLATSGFGVGVRGDLEEPTASGAAGQFFTFSPTSVAGQFVNVSRQGLILQGLSGPFDATQREVFRVDADGNLHITGNLTVDGTKSSTAKLQNGREVALYAVESPENWFEDFGSGTLQNGVAWVPLDASFAEATNTAVNYHVFLTANGDTNGLYVARKTAAGFEVREHGAGGSNVAFDYRIVVRRRGYETTRMAEVHHDTRIQELSRQHFRSLNRSEIIGRAQAMRKATIIPETRPIIPRPVVPEVPRVNVPQTPKVTVPQPRKPR